MKAKYLLFFSLSFFSCNGKKNNEHVSLNIETNINKLLKTSSFAKSVLYIKLNYSPKAFIGEASKIRFFNGELVLLDKKLSQILIFNENGDLLCKTNNYGKGPLEVSNIVDFYIDTINKQIEALDVAGYKVIAYNLGLTPINQTKVKINGQRNFYKLSNTFYLLFNDNSPFEKAICKTISLIDTLGNHINSYVDNSDLLYLLSEERNCFNEFGGKIVFNRSFTNDIVSFDLKGKKAILEYSIDFTNHKLPSDIFKEYIRQTDKFSVYNAYLVKLIEIANSGKYVFGLRDIYENDKYLFFGYDLTTTPDSYYVVYDKSTKMLHTGLPINDLSDETRFGKPVYMDGKRLYTAIFDEEADAYSIAIYELK